MERSSAAAAAVMLAVLLAGCTGLQGGGEDTEGQQVTPNDGLTIDFRPQFQSIQENKILPFQVEVANTGEADAEITERTVFGSPFLDIGGRCQDMGRLAVGTTLRSGSSEQFTWTCDAPLGNGDAVIDLEEGATDTFPAGLELQYSYSTSARTTVTVANPGRFEQSSPVTTDNTAGPVHARIQLASPQSARETDSGEGENGTLSVPVTVRNVGDGTVAGDGVALTVTVDGTERGIGRDRVQLVDGSRQVVLEVPGFALGEDELEKSVGIKIMMDYEYTEQSSSQFTVEGQPPGVRVETRE